GLPNAKWRVLDKCHSARNLAEYEGHMDVNPQLLRELIAITRELQVLVKDLPPMGNCSPLTSSNLFQAGQKGFLIKSAAPAVAMHQVHQRQADTPAFGL